MEGSFGDGGRQGINLYSLVAYLPPAIARFIEPLRRELVTTCQARAHVTVLPPRPLDCNANAAAAQLSALVRDFQPFWVRLGDVQVFPVSDVVYITIGGGAEILRELHTRTNAGLTSSVEDFVYQPHVTLAQKLPAAMVQQAFERARQAWREFDGPREFLVDELTFVQNTISDCWVDLERFPLNEPVLK